MDYISITTYKKEISLSFCIESEKPFPIGEKMNEINENAYMNGYNWEAFFNYYLSQNAPDVLKGLVSDSDAGTYVAVYKNNSKNEKKVNKFAEIIRSLVENEDELYRIIREEGENIEWD